MNRPYIVCNPGSRSAKGRRDIEGYLRLLEARGVPFEHAFTRDLPDALSLTRQAVAEGYETVVAAGGDGTINRVLTGLFGEGECRAGAALGVLYAGTSPDFCRFHGIPTRGEEAVEALLSGRRRRVDACRIRYRNPAGQPAEAVFGCSANVGLGPEIAGWSNEHRRLLGDFLGTLAATVIAILRDRRFSGELLLDGEAVPLRDCRNLTIGKNPHLASGLRLDVDVTASDGRLFAFAVRGVGLLRFLTLLPKAYSGKIVDDERFMKLSGSKIRLNTNGKCPGVEFDGDPMGACPVEVEVLPGAVEFVGLRGSNDGRRSSGRRLPCHAVARFEGPL